MADIKDRIRDIESAIRIDPARRGLLAGEASALLGLGHLAAAAQALSENAGEVGIVTGFPISTDDGPLAETDGPPGAALLADVCRQLGMRVRLITDSVAREAVGIAARAIGMPETDVESCPLDRPAGAQWCREFRDRAGSLTHLIAIERPGPSHTLDSILTVSGPSIRDTYSEFVPREHHDGCHNMRGENIDEHTGPLHLLFEGIAKVRRSQSPDERPYISHSSVRTIGIGDGGNEIGMGSFAWETLHRAIAGAHGRRIACRIATDRTILAGTSNWGAFALAAALSLIRERADLIEAWTTARHRELLEALVEDGPAVDGVTRERTATVDGLPFVTYMQPWERIREIVNCRD